MQPYRVALPQILGVYGFVRFGERKRGSIADVQGVSRSARSVGSLTRVNR